MNRVLLIAHAPLASALRDCAVHVFPDAAQRLSAFDVQPDAAPEASLAGLRALCASWPQTQVQGVLVLSDVYGATPCNVASRLVDALGAEGQREAVLIAGVNLPMVLRALSYVGEPLQALATRAMLGGTQGILRVAPADQPRQTRRPA